MKVKTYFSTIAFLIFFPTYRILKKLVYIRIRLILVVTKNVKKFTDLKRKYWRTKLENMKKSRTTRSHLTHARSCSRALNEFLRVRNDRLSSGRILCEKEIFFLLIILRVTRNVTKTNLGEFYRSHLQQDLSSLLLSL